MPAKTMKAAVVRNFHEPLTIEEVPVPAPQYGEVLVKIAATGNSGDSANGNFADHAVGAAAESGLSFPASADTVTSRFRTRGQWVFTSWHSTWLKTTSRWHVV